MNIFEAIAIFLIGGLVGYMVCMTFWVKELYQQAQNAEMQITKILAEMREEDGNNNQHN